MTAPVLRIADPDGDFIVCMDASKEGLGGVLLQNYQTIYYKSWKLKEHHLYAKFSKCDFYKLKINYLGHIISEIGIAIESEKIKAIKDWPTPNSVTHIRSFLGLAEYYHNFIDNFSRISFPMIALQNK